MLRDVTLQLHGGDRLAVVGPTGSGKTLLLRAIAQLDKAEEGEVLWHGRMVASQDVPTFRSRIVYLHQRPALFDGSIEDNLRRPFTLAVHRERKYDQGRIETLLKSLGRDLSFLSKKPGDLSGGEAQIVALLRAVQIDPEVLLLDEPTAALDATATEAVETLVESWLSSAAESRSLIWISHDMVQTKRIANRTLVMNRGQIIVET